MGIKSRHLAIVEHKDAIAVLDAANALGNNDFCHVGQVVAQGCTNAGVGGVVAGAGAVVKHHDFGPFQ